MARPISQVRLFSLGQNLSNKTPLGSLRIMGEIHHRDIVFLLGAGASVEAKVPNTYSFVSQFVDSVKDNEEKEVITLIINELTKWEQIHSGKEEVDIELLLEVLMKLEDKENEALLQFYNPRLDLSFDFSKLIKDLKDFIKCKAIVPEEELGYLQPLIEFIEEVPNLPLDIISLNYDICIEQFCNIHKLNWKDGFNVHWDANTFQDINSDVRLYKLHGSVMWYKSDRGDYIKVPIMTESSEIQLITGEKAKNVMLYPMRKWDYIEPIFELLLRAKSLLESEWCKYLICVGYSFRDDHIRDILWDVARKNKELHLVIIDPRAYSIYNERLKYYNDIMKSRSSLCGKVICLPYMFGGILRHHLKNHYLPHLRLALRSVNDLRKKEILGYEIDPREAIRELAYAEYIEKFEEINPKLKYNLENDWELILGSSLRMALHLYANNEKEASSKYMKDFIDTLRTVLVDRMDVRIIGLGFDRDEKGKELSNAQKNTLDFMFNYIKQGNASHANSARDFSKLFSELNHSSEIIKGMSVVPGNIETISSRIKSLAEYFSSLDHQSLTLDKYLELRRGQVEIKELENSLEQFNKTTTTLNTIDTLRSKIMSYEKGLLENMIELVKY